MVHNPCGGLPVWLSIFHPIRLLYNDLQVITRLIAARKLLLSPVFAVEIKGKPLILTPFSKAATWIDKVAKWGRNSINTLAIIIAR